MYLLTDALEMAQQMMLCGTKFHLFFFSKLTIYLSKVNEHLWRWMNNYSGHFPRLHLTSPTMDESGHPERGIHGRTEVFFMPTDRPKQDAKPFRERDLNKRAMDLKQTGGIVKIKGGQMQFGRHREGKICPGRIAQDKGDMEWSDKARTYVHLSPTRMYQKYSDTRDTSAGILPSQTVTKLYEYKY